MGVTASDKGGGSFQLPPVGNHIGICRQVIDLGTQDDTWLGKKKLIRKVRISFETPNEKATFDEARGEECFLVSKEYTLSLSEKANLRHDLESWRGLAFTEKELEGFALGKLIGAAAMINVIHKKSTSGRMYSLITAITSLPRGMKKGDVPKPTLAAVEYSIDDGNNEVFKKLPEFLQEKILASEEVKAAAIDGGSKSDTPPSTGDDEVPF